MNHTYVPKCVRENGWKGHVVMRQMSVDEYFDMAQERSAPRIDDGNVDKTAANLQFSRSLIKSSEPYYVDVDLTNPEGVSFKSFKDLMALGKPAILLLQEIALAHMNGFEDEGKSEAPPASK